MVNYSEFSESVFCNSKFTLNIPWSKISHLSKHTGSVLRLSLEESYFVSVGKEFFVSKH